MVLVQVYRHSVGDMVDIMPPALTCEDLVLVLKLGCMELESQLVVNSALMQNQDAKSNGLAIEHASYWVTMAPPSRQMYAINCPPRQTYTNKLCNLLFICSNDRPPL